MIILYFHTGLSTFVDKDIKILEEKGTVRRFNFSSSKKWKTPGFFILQIVFLFRYIFQSDLMVVQFAGYHSFLPAIFGRLSGKKTLIIAGGTDCVSYPAIGYGNFQKSLLGLFTRWSYRLCHHISPKHDSLRFCEYGYDSSAPSKQGILAFMPELDKPFTAIPNGYDAGFWHCVGEVRNKKTFITVSSGLEYPFQTRLKGIDLILDAAPELTDCTFTIVGVPEHIKLPLRSENVRVLPPADSATLRKLYCQHAFYVQVSMAEGFPNALSEAMLCGCVPIGSSVFSIPEIIGENGFLLK
ncbi:MAG: glycosyltransferase family 4 protein, partial [Bacteroidota bacterium]